MTMKNVVFALILAYLVLACMLKGVSSCKGNSFIGCECNILGACVINAVQDTPKQGIDTDKLTHFAPLGVEQFGYAPWFSRSLAYLCESETVAILYDCNARIPLYAATVMTGDQLNGPGTARPEVDFQQSTAAQLDPNFQQNQNDYRDSNLRNLCYESRGFLSGSNYFVDANWYRAAAQGTPQKNPQPCEPPYIIKTPVHKGHLIAARYGRGDPNRAKATFTYTNAVPQFGVFNSGQWNRDEGEKVVKWGEQNCANHNGKPTQNARMYIVVGAIPSTFGSFPRRFFGESGFSDYQSWSKRPQTTFGTNTGNPKEYRVNVPRLMWTAVCCTFQVEVQPGVWQAGVQSNAFYRGNEPGKQPNYPGLFTAEFSNIQPVRVFPQGCNL